MMMMQEPTAAVAMLSAGREAHGVGSLAKP